MVFLSYSYLKMVIVQGLMFCSTI